MDDIDRDQAEHLKNLRLAAGLDHAQLAAMSNLSAAQLRQLEEGGESLFYSPQIKSQSMRRIIRLLENPVTNASPSKVYAEEAAPRATGNVIEDIIRLSETNHKGSFLTTTTHNADRSGLIFSIIVFVSVCLAAFSWWKSSQETTVNVFTEWIDPLPINLEQSASPPAAVITQTPASTSTQEVAVVQSPAETVSAGAANAMPPAALAKNTAIASLNGSVAPINEQSLASKSEKNDCNSINSEALSAKPYSVSKPGNYIYMLATKTVQLCVDDGLKNRTVVNLEPGVGRSVHGSAPWTVSSHSLSTVQIYFQGSKVNLPSDTANRIYLKEQIQSP